MHVNLCWCLWNFPLHSSSLSSHGLDISFWMSSSIRRLSHPRRNLRGFSHLRLSLPYPIQSISRSCWLYCQSPPQMYSFLSIPIGTLCLSHLRILSGPLEQSDNWPLQFYSILLMASRLMLLKHNYFTPQLKIL